MLRRPYVVTGVFIQSERYLARAPDVIPTPTHVCLQTKLQMLKSWLKRFKVLDGQIIIRLYQYFKQMDDCDLALRDRMECKSICSSPCANLSEHPLRASVQSVLSV